MATIHQKVKGGIWYIRYRHVLLLSTHTHASGENPGRFAETGRDYCTPSQEEKEKATQDKL